MEAAMRAKCVLVVMNLLAFVAFAQKVPEVEPPLGFSMISAHPDFAPVIGAGTPNGFRHVGGLDFAAPDEPQGPSTANCTISPTEIIAGDPLLATMSTPTFDPDHIIINYVWSTTGGKSLGLGAVTNLDTVGLAPGSYTVTGTATDPRKKLNGTVSCSVSFTVKPPPPPPMTTCSAVPAAVTIGQPATITVAASSPDGRPLTYSYATTAGNITGSGNTGNLATTGAVGGMSITVTATVVDEHHQTASCTAVVNVLAPPVAVPAPPVTIVEVREVGTCNFSDPKRAARVDNVCKAVLDEVALQLRREPNGRLVVVGYAEEAEVLNASDIDGQRSVNIKHYLTEGEGQAGIDPARIEARTGPHGSKSSKLYFVPQDASFTSGETVIVDESKTKGHP
jgi:hypothetical protein